MADVNFNGFPVTTTVPSTDIILVGNPTNGVRNATKADFLKEVVSDTTYTGKTLTYSDLLTPSINRCMQSPKVLFIAFGFTANANMQPYDRIITNLEFTIGTSEYFPIFDITDGSTKWAYGYQNEIILRSPLTSGHIYAFSHTFI